MAVTFREVKGGGEHTAELGPMGAKAVVALIALSDYHPPTGKRRDTLVGVGPGQAWSWVRRASAACGVSAWPHLFRHVGATWMVEAGTPIELVTRQGGWVDPRVPMAVYVGELRKQVREAAL